jgi:hypothetical protein
VSINLVGTVQYALSIGSRIADKGGGYIFKITEIITTAAWQWLPVHFCLGPSVQMEKYVSVG